MTNRAIKNAKEPTAIANFIQSTSPNQAAPSHATPAHIPAADRKVSGIISNVRRSTRLNLLLCALCGHWLESTSIRNKNISRPRSVNDGQQRTPHSSSNANVWEFVSPVSNICWGSGSQKRSARPAFGHDKHKEHQNNSICDIPDPKATDNIDICCTFGQTHFEFVPFRPVILSGLDKTFQRSCAK
ncbi:hypothetical protein EDC04DRAFT_1097825 [Pisolithus marmoratus]|nr:hypothetical protein EDC04DRAFT_1097825 [Pisolithus marmoratus]